MAMEGRTPVLKKSRWLLLKREENLRTEQRFRLRDLLRCTQAPHGLPVGRLDEVATARQINAYLQGQSEDPILRWKPAT